MEKYRLVGVLGRGGMGVVFDAQHQILGRRVALKVLAPEVMTNPEAVTRFMNEARAAARISSECVVQVLDVGTLPAGLPYMVMERLEGVDLGELLVREPQLPVSHWIDLLVEGVEGVAHAHLEGIIHRDLKPSNLFCAVKADRSSIVKVLDFGISKLTDSHAGGGGGSVTSTSTILGSPLYMSPEQLRSAKNIDLRADIWSLGVIAYEVLTRTLPFEGDNLVELFASIQAHDARPLTEIRRDLPPALDQVVRRCLRRAPEERYPSAFALGQALAPFGGARALASLRRLEGHVSSGGGSVAELGSTMPELDARALRTGSGAPAPRAIRSGSHPGIAPVGTPYTPYPQDRSTAAPWSNTRDGASTSSVARRGSVVAIVLGMVTVGALGLGALRLVGGAGHSASGAPPAPDVSSADASAPALPSSQLAAVVPALGSVEDADAGGAELAPSLDVSPDAAGEHASSHHHHQGSGGSPGSPASPNSPPSVPATTQAAPPHPSTTGAAASPLNMRAF